MADGRQDSTDALILDRLIVFLTLKGIIDADAFSAFLGGVQADETEVGAPAQAAIRRIGELQALLACVPQARPRSNRE